MSNKNNHFELIGSSSKMQSIEHLINCVAKKTTTTLILGESGTGKELVARCIHDRSSRSSSPFIAVNCAAIPLELLESELFGHEKGAFTGAYSMRQGRFELAKGGTLFLDEIGDMPASMQAKLLRVLQERVFERVGSSKLIEADVRIIAATHRNLEECIIEGTFRSDLYYRLNVFPIEIPALRERQSDIPALVNHFVKAQYAKESVELSVTPEGMRALCHYHWPGNIRELFNLLEQFSVLYTDKPVDVADFPEKIKSSVANLNTNFTTSKNFDLKEHLTDLELNLISQALQDTNWVIAKAAKKLGLRRTTLVEKIKKHGIDRRVHP